jgi:hypothetical protein
MDGTEGLGTIYHQLHTIGRRVHSNAGTRHSQKNTILGFNPYVQGLSAVLYCLCLLSLWSTSSCKFFRAATATNGRRCARKAEIRVTGSLMESHYGEGHCRLHPPRHRLVRVAQSYTVLVSLVFYPFLAPFSSPALLYSEAAPPAPYWSWF